MWRKRYQHFIHAIININLIVKICHKTAYNLNIRPLYKMNVGEENFSEMI